MSVVSSKEKVPAIFADRLFLGIDNNIAVLGTFFFFFFKRYCSLNCNFYYLLNSNTVKLLFFVRIRDVNYLKKKNTINTAISTFVSAAKYVRGNYC